MKLFMRLIHYSELISSGFVYWRRKKGSPLCVESLIRIQARSTYPLLQTVFVSASIGSLQQPLRGETFLITATKHLRNLGA